MLLLHGAYQLDATASLYQSTRLIRQTKKQQQQQQQQQQNYTSYTRTNEWHRLAFVFDMRDEIAKLVAPAQTQRTAQLEREEHFAHDWIRHNERLWIPLALLVDLCNELQRCANACTERRRRVDVCRARVGARARKPHGARTRTFSRQIGQVARCTRRFSLAGA